MEHIIALFTLTSMEIVLGIDNIVFIALLTGRFPLEQQDRIRRVGLLAAMGMRVVLLLFITVIAKLTFPLFTLFDHGFTGRDLILLFGGLFLIAKATYEIHHKIEGEDEEQHLTAAAPTTFGNAILQILLIDMVFSLDSVITAVGMANELWVMVTAVVLAILVMMVFAGTVTRFIERHPTLKVLALSFLLLIGVLLAFEGFGGHMNRGYIYFAMGFSLFVEVLNIRLRSAGNRLAKRIQEVQVGPPGIDSDSQQ